MRVNTREEWLHKATHEIRREAKEADMTTLVSTSKSLLYFMKVECHTEFKRIFTEKGWSIEEMEEKTHNWQGSSIIQTHKPLMPTLS